VAAFEILVVTPAVRNLIREGKTHQIPTQIQMGARYGMQTLEAAMRSLVMKGLITDEEYQRRISHLAETGAHVSPPGGGGFDSTGQRPGSPGVRGTPYDGGGRLERAGRPGNSR
jgi:hypothetical protein